MKRHLAIAIKKSLQFFVHLTLLTLFFLFPSQNVSAQQPNVSGTVTGDNNVPLSGASVTIKGGAKGTSTNASGSFTLSAPANATLVFSSVGYTPKEVAVAGRSSIDVSLVA